MSMAHPTLMFLNNKQKAIMGAVPTTLRSALTWERIMQAVGQALVKSTKLQECSPDSVYRSVLEIVGKGLDIGMDGQAYLVPFKGECTALIGAQGKIELAHRSGMIDRIVCQVVYGNDTVEIDLAEGTVKHPLTLAYLAKGVDDPDFRGPMLACYARIWVKGVAEPMLELMTIGDFDKIKAGAAKRSGGRLSPAYTEWPSEMFRRSCLNRALKRAPKSRDLMEVLNRETALEEQDPDLNVIDAPSAQVSGHNAAAQLPDHGEPEDVEQELAKLKERERAPARTATPPADWDRGDDDAPL